jgi:CRISPR-associated endonuclease/helicase Cas3
MIWDDPNTKESHPNKKLSQHINEVDGLLTNFADFYGIKYWARDLIKPIILHHDDGKLNPAWSINNKQNPPHAELSLRYMKEKGIFEEIKQEFSNELFPIILYLILKHHSALVDITSSRDGDLKMLCSDIVRNQVKKISFNKRIEIADVFGLFKLADSLSASDKADFRFEKPLINDDTVKKIIASRSGSIDMMRWKEQIGLSELPNVSLLTAYTGWGKTDASLLFFSNKDVNKIFYLFPTITAINKFYDKLAESLNRMVDKYFYYYEYEMANKFGESDDEAQEYLFTAFTTRHFLNQIVLTTIDQFLLAFLQLGKYYTKRVMFRRAGLVLDEIHLLNPKMLALVLHFLKIFSSTYDLKVLFMSATFSEALMQVIEDALPNVEKMDLSRRYKELSRINYYLDLKRDLFDAIYGICSQWKAKKKVLVVANTVDTVVLLAKKLERLVDQDCLVLLHARFMYTDRKKKEEAIEKLKNTPHILLATQVCEVSLDVSYDVLFTEVAPLPSLIQRFGRVNRYGKKADGINVWIYKAHRKTESSRYPYEDVDLNDATKILEELYPLGNEYQLIKKYNEVEDYDTMLKRIDDAEKEIDLKALWENDERTGYFFTFKLDDEQVRKRLLQFREELTVTILPAPECIEEDSRDDVRNRRELEKLLEVLKDKTISKSRRAQLFDKIKGYLVPVPIWWVIGEYDRATTGLPIVRFKNRLYASRYGFLETSELVNVI